MPGNGGSTSDATVAGAGGAGALPPPQAGAGGSAASFDAAPSAGMRGDPAVDSGSAHDAATGAGDDHGAAGTLADAAVERDSGAARADTGMHHEFALMPVGLQKANDEELAFPPDAINTVSISPEFTWSGAPPEAKSLALVFKWVVWNIPPTVTDLPKGISPDSPNLSEIPGATQLGALGHQGYYGPCCTANHYQWVLWALDVDELPGAEGQTTAYIRDTLLPMHELATTPPVLMRRVTP